MNDDPTLLTVPEAAKLLRISRNLAYEGLVARSRRSGSDASSASPGVRSRTGSSGRQLPSQCPRGLTRCRAVSLRGASRATAKRGSSRELWDWPDRKAGTQELARHRRAEPRRTDGSAPAPALRRQGNEARRTTRTARCARRTRSSLRGPARDTHGRGVGAGLAAAASSRRTHHRRHTHATRSPSKRTSCQHFASSRYET